MRQVVQRPDVKPRPLGTGRDPSRRALFHHLPIAVASTLGFLALVAVTPSHGGGRTFSIGRLTSPTGDIALVLLGVTLLVGPVNLLLRRRNPPHNYLRRDLGWWAAIWSIVHVILAFQGHGGGAFSFVDFFFAGGRPLTSSFGIGNWLGLAALVIMVGLMVMATDRYMRQLKAPAWKSLQRLNYTLFVLSVVHGLFYGALRSMTSPFTLVMFATVIVVVGGQAVGVWLWRRRRSRAENRIAEPEPRSARALLD
jgi:sulfoxide reductase heme-binding subunit YedZ